MTYIVPTPKVDNLYRSELLGIIQAGIDSHERSAQQEIGPSGVGGCERKTAFQLAYGAAQDSPGGWAAHKGTQLHRWLEETFNEVDSTMPDGTPRFMTEVKLESSAPGIISGGTCDLYDRLHQRVVDWKCPGSFTMDKVRNGQWSESYFKQAQVYGYHLSRMGYPVSSVALAMLPMSGDQLHSERQGAVFAYWDYDEQVAIESIGNLTRINTMLTIAEVRGVSKQKVIESMNIRSDFCSSCPAAIMSSDRRGTCPGADVRIPPRDPNNPFG